METAKEKRDRILKAYNKYLEQARILRDNESYAFWNHAIGKVEQEYMELTHVLASIS